MIFSSFFRALGQLGDSRFRRVLGLGVLLAAALLLAAYAAFLQLLWWLTPDSIDMPIIGPVTGIGTLLGWASLLVMILLSTVLMVPVAAAFTGLFLEDVAMAVEEKHYPRLRIPLAPSWSEQLRRAVNFLGLVMSVNTVVLLLVLMLLPVLVPLIPLIFWAVNGLLLGLEYFTLVALRWMPPNEVSALWKRNVPTLWVAGMLMAAPLSVPLINLVIPVLGVATFTHIFHRLVADRK
ncbi:MAG TPA: EI24 domain-containing protein [Tabrizicola sp.]|nr:EI24 domain-containing protein [Tabrizicola sp.]HMS95444.1 EI24 domain-containing protein [Tabrizicola sp.]